MKARVTGIKKFSGEVEGQKYDNTTLFVEMRLDDSQGTQKGRATVEFKYPNSDLFNKLSHLNFPCDLEIETEQVASGKGQFKTVVVSVNPIKAA